MDSPPPEPALLRGRVIFDDATEPFSGATLYVFLEDTTLADAGAVIVAETVLGRMAYDPAERNDLTFALDGVVPDERAHYAVRVLVDLDGDGRVSRGDFVNVESYPVLTWGHPREVSVRVERVG